MSEPNFDGETYDPTRDHERLAKQMGRVRDLMLDGEKRSLSEIGAATGDPDASVSARLRDLRKPKFGGYTVERTYRGSGVWDYRVLRPADTGRNYAPIPIAPPQAPAPAPAVSPLRPGAEKHAVEWPCSNCGAELLNPKPSLIPGYRRGKCQSCGKTGFSRRKAG